MPTELLLSARKTGTLRGLKKVRGKSLWIVPALMFLSVSTAHAVLTAPPTTGLKLWLDARDTDGDGNQDTLGDGTEVENWFDKSGSGNNAVARKDLTFSLGTTGTNPTFSAAGGPGGGSAISFNGIDQSYAMPEFMNSDTFSIFAIAKSQPDAGLGAKPIFWDYGDTGNKTVALTPVNSLARDGAPQAIVVSFASPLFTDWQAALSILSNNAGLFSLEAGAVGATTTNSNAAYTSTTWEGAAVASNFPSIGVFPDGNAGPTQGGHIFGGWMSQILIYDHAVTGQERTDVIAYLNGVLNPAPPAVPGDFDSDGDVDGADFVAWQTHFPTASGATLADGDADADGDVDGADFVVWQTNFPFTPGPSISPVPEPQSIALFTIGALLSVGAWKRRRHS